LYPIRGSTPRNVKAWMEAVDKMRYLKPKFVVGCHCDYVEGEETIQKELTLYRDTIAFVHDQTLRLMNRSLHIDDVVTTVLKLLPERMKQGRVQQFYGTVEWSIRAIFTFYVGWFTGEPADLYPATFTTRGKYMLHLFEQMAYFSQFGKYSQDKNLQRFPGDILRNIVSSMKQMLLDMKVDLSKDTVAYPEERFVLEMTTWLLNYLQKGDEHEDEQGKKKENGKTKKHPEL